MEAQASAREGIGLGTFFTRKGPSGSAGKANGAEEWPLERIS